MIAWIQAATRLAIGATVLLGMRDIAHGNWKQRIQGHESCEQVWARYGFMGNTNARAMYCEIREIGVLPGGKALNLGGGSNCGVRVIAQDRKDVQVRLIVQAEGPTTERARELAQAVTLDLHAAQLAPGHTRESRGEAARAILEVLVPRVQSVNAEVHNGPLHVEGLRGGVLELTAVNGPLELKDISGGTVAAHCQNGPLDVHLTGSEWQGGDFEAVAANGPLSLEVPKSYRARLTLVHENGPFQCSFPVLQRRRGQPAEVTLGRGGKTLRFAAHNGPMSVGYEGETEDDESPE